MGLLALYLVATFVDVWWSSTEDHESVGAETAGRRAAVVLGAAQYDGEPSPVLRARLDEGARLYEEGQVSIVVVTGGNQAGDVTTEAKAGYDYLRAAGIPDEQLLLEVQGGSTYESLAATARFIDGDEIDEVVLVTDRYHARRATLVAEEVGLAPVVSLTEQPPSFQRLLQETAAVSLGRLVSFRRLDQL